MSENYVQILVDTLEKKEKVLQDILSVTKRQEVISRADSYDDEAMEKTLNEKEVLISKLNYLDDGFQTVYERSSGEIKNHLELYRDSVLRMQDLIRVCTELGNEIQVLEERNRVRFQNLFTSTQSKYSGVKNQANVAQNYHKTMNNSKILDAYFVDKKY